MGSSPGGGLSQSRSRGVEKGVWVEKELRAITRSSAEKRAAYSSLQLLPSKNSKVHLSGFCGLGAIFQSLGWCPSSPSVVGLVSMPLIGVHAILLCIENVGVYDGVCNVGNSDGKTQAVLLLQLDLQVGDIVLQVSLFELGV